mgnify:CR=1 FL=1
MANTIGTSSRTRLFLRVPYVDQEWSTPCWSVPLIETFALDILSNRGDQ